VTEQTQDLQPGWRRLTLEIDLTAGLITGRITDGQTSWPFAGWLELSAALTTAIEDSRTP
jgi:hypothetical protein